MVGNTEAVLTDRGSPPGAIKPRYDAFISYSHETDGTLAPILQAGIEKFAKPWNRARALRVFRDDASLSAEPALWPSIEQALAESQWFVLLASAPAAKSEWVDREVQWWIQNRSSERLLIVVTNGVVRWDDQSRDFDWIDSTALPPSLQGVFLEEPRWVDASWSSQADRHSSVDPRLQDVIADVAARIRGVPKDDLVGVAVREHRRTRRIVRGVQATLGALLLVAIAATVFALIQRSTAVGQANIATSRQVAAVSETELTSNLDVALLLAARAYRTDVNPQTRSALFKADLFSPYLVRYLPMGGQVQSVTGSADQSTVVAGLADGTLMRQTLTDATHRVIASLGESVKSVAVSGDGRVVAAASGAHGVLWRAGAGVTGISCPAGESPASVGVSPSGRTVAVSCAASAFEGPQSVELIDGSTARLDAVHALGTNAPFAGAALILPSDGALLMFGSGGPWEWRAIPGWSLRGASSGGFGAHQGPAGYSGDGRYVTVTNGDPKIPVWSTSTPTTFDPTTAPLAAQAPIGAPTALTMSPDGTELAVADSGTVYVAPVLASSKPAASPVALTGNGSVNNQAVSFFGDRAHLLSASGDLVAVWGLDRVDRLATTQPSIFEPPCNGCQGALTAVSPDGRNLAAVANYGGQLVVQPLGGGRPYSLTGSSFGPPVWDGARLLLPLAGSPGPGSTTSFVRAWTAVPSQRSIAAAGLSGVGRSVAVVDQYGTLYLEDPDTGRVVKRVGGPRDLTSTQAVALTSGMAAIDSRERLVAMVDNGRAELQALPSGALVHRIPGSGAAFVAFAGSRLLVQRSDGSLEVWNPRGTSLERTLPGDQSYSYLYPVADSRGETVARRRSDGSTTLVDLDSGTTLVTVPAPVPSSWGLKLGLAFSPDGKKLISVVQTLAYDTSQIITHDFSTGTLVRAACTAAGRSLTAADWRAYVGSAPPSNLTCR